MTLNRSTAPAALEAFFRSLLGTPYSQSSPPGSDADGHLWVPGEGKPNHLDCSGATKYVVDDVVGIDIDQGNAGNAAGQWNRWANLRVSPPEPADLLYFIADGSPSAPGHTGMCLTFDAATGNGTYISAYDTAEGLVIKPFSIHADYVGAVRIVNLLPEAPPAPAPHPAPAPTAPQLAHAYAKAHGMVVIDVAEAHQAIASGISYYTWAGNMMHGSRAPQIPTNKVLFAFAANLDAKHIPHAGS